jgi:hypothetical protein
VAYEIRLGFYHRGKRGLASLKVGNKHFYRGCGALLPDFSDDRRKMTRPSVGQVIPGYGGYYHIAEPQTGDRLPDTLRFTGIYRLGIAMPDITKAAIPRTIFP